MKRKNKLTEGEMKSNIVLDKIVILGFIGIFIYFLLQDSTLIGYNPLIVIVATLIGLLPLILGLFGFLDMEYLFIRGGFTLWVLGLSFIVLDTYLQDWFRNTLFPFKLFGFEMQITFFVGWIVLALLVCFIIVANESTTSKNKLLKLEERLKRMEKGYEKKE